MQATNTLQPARADLLTITGEDDYIMTDTTPRLKKDGTPDRRNGNPGNAGNKHATGRKRIEGQETRKHICYKATEKEYRLLLQYAAILKDDYERGLELLAKMGTPPEGRAKKDSTRENHVIRVYEREKKPIKEMLSIIKDRYEIAYMIINGE